MPSVNRRSGRSRSGGGVFHRGGEGRKRVEEEVKKAKERAENRGQGFGPMRFFLKPGEEKTFVVLDDEPDFFLYEHTMKNPQTQKFTDHYVCIGKYATCPICEAGNYSAYIMVLSVLDLTPFEKRDGTVEEFSRKLLIVKPSQQKIFMRKFEREGSLRGAVFETARDKQTDAAIGNDLELIEFMGEDELMEDFIREWEDNDGKLHTENCGEPFVYEDIFKEPTEEELHAAVGTSADDTPGSRRQSRAALKDDDYGEEEGEEEDRNSRGSSRRGSSRRSGTGDRGSKRSTRTRRSRRSEEEEEEPPFDPDEPPPRGVSRRGRRAGKDEDEPRSSRRSSARTGVSRRQRRD